MNVSLYVSELLYRYDCVIVPDLGGFLTNYKPASIHPAQHLFIPPSKSIAFNASLKNNDGLLANHIAEKENISFAKANLLISDFIKECNDTLKANKRIELQKVGILSVDAEGNLSFEPDKSVNYLCQSFGLTNFVSPAVKRVTLKKRLEKKFIDRNPNIVTDVKIMPARIKWATVMSLPVIALVMWLSFNNNLLKNTYNNYTDIISMFIYSQENSIINKEVALLKNEKSNSSTLTFPSLFDSTGIINMLKTNEKPETVAVTDLVVNTPVEVQKEVVETEKITEVPVEAEEEISTPVETKKYYIIGGCFGVPENAKKYVNELKQKGHIDAQIIGKTDTGLLRVTYGGYNSRDDAERDYATIKKSENPYIWMLEL